MVTCQDDYWEEFGLLYRGYRDKLVTAAHMSSGPVWDLDFCRRTFENILAHLGNDHVEVALMTMIDEPPRRGEWLETLLAHLRRHVTCQVVNLSYQVADAAVTSRYLSSSKKNRPTNKIRKKIKSDKSPKG